MAVETTPTYFTAARNSVKAIEIHLTQKHKSFEVEGWKMRNKCFAASRQFVFKDNHQFRFKLRSQNMKTPPKV